MKIGTEKLKIPIYQLRVTIQFAGTHLETETPLRYCRQRLLGPKPNKFLYNVLYPHDALK